MFNVHKASIEKDDEGNNRAILVDLDSENKIDKGLVRQAIKRGCLKSRQPFFIFNFLGLLIHKMM